MPSKSWRQARMMAKAAKDPDYAAERNVPQRIAEEFHNEDLKEQVYFTPEGNLVPQEEAAEREMRFRTDTANEET